MSTDAQELAVMYCVVRTVYLSWLNWLIWSVRMCITPYCAQGPVGTTSIGPIPAHVRMTLRHQRQPGRQHIYPPLPLASFAFDSRAWYVPDISRCPGLWRLTAKSQLPLGLLNAAQGHPMLVELKNGETLNGHLVQCDTWMNLTLKEVVQTNPVGSTIRRSDRELRLTNRPV